MGVDLCKANPYDGHTLAQAIATAERTTDVAVTDAYVDKGYLGHDYQGDATIHISGTSTRQLTRTQRKQRRRRSEVEPKIDHLKSGHRLSRCFLKGLADDAVNLVLAAAGSNLRKLLGRSRLRCSATCGASLPQPAADTASMSSQPDAPPIAAEPTICL